MCLHAESSMMCGSIVVSTALQFQRFDPEPVSLNSVTCFIERINLMIKID